MKEFLPSSSPLQNFLYPLRSAPAAKEIAMIIVVTNCKECPFVFQGEQYPECNVSTPKRRPLDPDTYDRSRPSFCPLRREQVIVREKP